MQIASTGADKLWQDQLVAPQSTNFGAVFNFGPVKLRKQKLIMSVGYSVDKKNPTQLAQPGQGSYILCWLVILFDKGAAKKVLCTVYN